MNLIFVNPTKKLRVGMVNLIKGLSRDTGNNIFLLTPLEVANPFRDSGNVNLIVYPSIFLPKIRYTLPNFISQYHIIRKLIVKVQIDIIHCWSYFYPVNLIPLFCSYKFRIPIITTTDVFVGIGWSYGGHPALDLVARVYTKTIGKFVLKRMNRLVLLGHYLKKQTQLLGLTEYEVIPLPVETDRFRNNSSGSLRRQLGISDADTVLINVGRLVPVKGIERLILVTKALVKDGYRVKTLIVGNGPYRKEYEELAKHDTSIVFLGERNDVPDLLAISDIFVLTSVSEGFPNCLLEASAAGLPIVSSDVGGVCELIENGKNGFIANSIDSYVTHIRDLMCTPNLKERMGNALKVKMRQKFTTERVVTEYRNIYENLIHICRRSHDGRL